MSTQTGAAPISGAVLTRLFDFSYNTTRGNVEGFTHEDSLQQPQLSGNCLNWVVGHIVATRNHILGLLGKAPVWSDEQIKRYDRGSDPIVSAEEAIPWDRILKDLDETQEKMRAEFARLTPEELAQPIPEDKNPFGLDSVGEFLAAFNFHESYHAGQTGILRRVLGREGAIN